MKIKKTAIIIISILFIIIGALMFVAALYYVDAKFNIKNTTTDNVSLSGTWRQNEKIIGTLKPADSK